MSFTDVKKIKSVDLTTITPSFKQLDYLGCCIASVADQDGVTVEHIVQDAGSPGVEEFAQEMGARLLRMYGGERVTSLEKFELLHIRTAHGYALRIFKEKDDGMYDAINKGIEKATGLICGYLNCDEQYLNSALLRVKKAFDKDIEIGVVLGDVIVINHNGEAICHRKIETPTLAHTWTCHFSALTAAVFFRKSEISEGLLFDISYRMVSDAEWFVRILRSRLVIEVLRTNISTFMESGQNLGLTPAAEKERKRLNASAPFMYRKLKILWVALHRIKRLIGRQHRSEDVAYEVYLPEGDKRKAFTAKRLRTTWPGRILNF
jgi:glycosyltransferase involved in cell wall biosynthesis